MRHDYGLHGYWFLLPVALLAGAIAVRQMTLDPELTGVWEMYWIVHSVS